MKLILRMSKEGMPIELIAKVLEISVAAVKWSLERVDGVAAQESEASYEDPEEAKLKVEAQVKQLLKDPQELCCPISMHLMEDPVIAADGHTYERSFILKSFEVKNESPLTNAPLQTLVLYPNQDKKSAVLVHKEKVVEGVLSISQHFHWQNCGKDAFQLLDRAEAFVRPLLPDTSAQKKLLALLVARMKLLKPGTRDSLNLEVTLLLLDGKDSLYIRKVLRTLEAGEIKSVLRKLEDKVLLLVKTMMSPYCCDLGLTWYRAVDLEMVRRFSRGLDDDERLHVLWMFLHEEFYYRDQCAFTKAIAVVLMAFVERLQWCDVQLESLDQKLLLQVCSYLKDRKAAIQMANDFFEYDFGLANAESWPPKGCGSIMMEVAFRSDGAEKIRLIAEAYKLDAGHPRLRARAVQHLHRFLMDRDRSCMEESEDEVGKLYHDAEGLFLKLVLEDRRNKLPEDLIPHLTLQNDLLNSLSPDQLMLLTQQIGKIRGADGSRLAVKAAKMFAKQSEDKSQDALLQAFRLDQNNADAANGLVKTVVAMKEKCKDLEKRCQDRPMVSFAWDMSTFDFTNFKKGDRIMSDPLPLSTWGIEAHLFFFPLGEEGSDRGKAAVHLHFKNVAYVKGKIQGGIQVSFDFALDHPTTSWVQPNFMDESRIMVQKDATITLHIFEIQLSQSSWRLVS